MKKDLTDLTVVMDRSGSMQTIQKDAEGGLNSFIEQQKKQPGECTFTLVQFDNIYEFVHKAVPIQKIGHVTLTPRGSTALLDAVGRAIAETGERLAAMPEAERPGLVVFVILTDGQENASREYDLVTVKKMILEQQETYKWQFTYLGANQDAFAEAAGMGVKTCGAINFAPDKAALAYNIAAKNVTKMRTQSAGGQSVDNSYSDEDREAVK